MKSILNDNVLILEPENEKERLYLANSFASKTIGKGPDPRICLKHTLDRYGKKTDQVYLQIKHYQRKEKVE